MLFRSHNTSGGDVACVVTDEQERMIQGDVEGVGTPSIAVE